MNLCLFCDTAAGKLQKKMSSNVYFHCILFTRFSCGAIIIICHFLLFVLQSADFCTLLQKQRGPVVNTSSLPDIMLVIKAKSEPKKPNLHTRCSGKFDWFSIPIMMQFFQLTRRLMYSKVSIIRPGGSRLLIYEKRIVILDQVV